jgi:U11/U12 small nuclear ribonucleoprotein SNRNP65
MKKAQESSTRFPPLIYNYPPANVRTVVKIAIELLRNPAFYIKVCHIMNLLNIDPPFQSDISLTRIHPIGYTIHAQIAESIGSECCQEEYENQEIDQFQQTHSLSKEATELFTKIKLRNIYKAIEREKMMKELKVENIEEIPQPRECPCDDAIKPINRIPNSMSITNNVIKCAPPINSTELPMFIESQKEKERLYVETYIEAVDMDEYYHRMQEIVKDDVPASDASDGLLDQIDDIKVPEYKAPSTVEEIIQNRHTQEFYSDENEIGQSLYIKNVHRKVKQEDIERVIKVISDHENIYDPFTLKLYKKGSIRNQCFVNFETVGHASKVLRLLDGYIMYDKELVVRYAKRYKPDL